MKYEVFTNSLRIIGNNVSKKLIAPLIFGFAFFTASAKQDQTVNNPYSNYFNEAYSLYPTIPRGVLEAVSFCNTHFNHITHQPNEEGSCIGMPKSYGVMGLILDGKNYFANNLKYISTLSGYSEDEILNSPEKNILAYAKAFSSLYVLPKFQSINTLSTSAEVLIALSELPRGTKGQYFAVCTQLYGYFSFMTDPKNQTLYNFPDPHFDLPKLFQDNYSILSSSSVTVSKNGVTDKNGNSFQGSSDPTIQSPDYGPAIWNPAASCNFASGRSSAVTAVTIHDTEGPYSSAISWFQNCSAVVSAHYVVRSSDGQITQMVLESNTAWHVGSENSYTVGIEHEGIATQTGWYTTAMYTASAALTADICASHGIDPGRTGFWPWMHTTYYSSSTIPGACCRVKGHQHYPNQSHTDPGPNWDWDYYYKLINPQPTATSYTASSGNFYDSGGPSGNYADDERSVWTISPTNATQVTMNFSAFNVENTWDYIYIYDGTDVWAPLIGYWTGTNSPGTVVANSGSMTIEFRSDCSTNSTGWNASYTSNSNVVLPTNLSVTAAGCQQLQVALNWNNSGANWFVDISTSPSFTTFYNKAVPNLTSIVCPGGFCDYPNCLTYLQFRPATTYYWRVFNGSTQTNGGSFTTPNCATTNTNCSGTFDDTGGPSGTYNGNEDYTYTIAPTNASSVTMNFTSFNTELNSDSLYIYNGPTINSPLIGTYTGINSPGTVVANSGKMTLHFVSDPFVNNAGWAATWNCSTVSTGMDGSISQTLTATIYPNPANGDADLTYVLGNTGPVQIQLIDMLGRQINLLNEAAQSSGEHTLHIDLNALALSTGIYDVRIISSGANSNLKLIVK